MEQEPAGGGGGMMTLYLQQMATTRGEFLPRWTNSHQLQQTGPPVLTHCDSSTDSLAHSCTDSLTQSDGSALPTGTVVLADSDSGVELLTHVDTTHFYTSADPLRF